jgi:hypothetical protein
VLGDRLDDQATVDGHRLRGPLSGGPVDRALLLDSLYSPRPQPGRIGVEPEHDLGGAGRHPTGETISEPFVRGG